jgi:LysM repeat protein
MSRSSAAVALVAILPGLAVAQEGRTHTVTAGNTLWGIAAQYLGDPYQWPRIHEANLDRIDNPHRIFPGWVVRIPDGSAAAVVQVSVMPGPPGDAVPAPQVAPPPPPPQAAPAPQVVVQPQVPQTAQTTQRVGDHTVFWTGPRQSFVGSVFRRTLWDVTPEDFYSAPWLIPPGTIPESTGSLVAFEVEPEPLAYSANSARPFFDRLHVVVEGPMPTVGQRLQVFRVDREIDDVGHVVTPTGILVVQTLATDGVVATVESQFGRILLGDLVRPLPPFTPVTTDALMDATTGMEATVLSYATERGVQIAGNFAFLDVGSDDGVRIGDEYVLIGGTAGGFPGQVEGRVKVVSVLQDVSTARIIGLENPVFLPGVRLRPDRRVR